MDCNANEPVAGEKLILLKSGESGPGGLLAYGLYCVVSGSRAASNAPPGSNLLLVLRNSGAKWIDLEGVTTNDFTLQDSESKNIKTYLRSSPRGMAYGACTFIHFEIGGASSAPQPWTRRLRIPDSTVKIDLVIPDIEPRAAAPSK